MTGNTRSYKQTHLAQYYVSKHTTFVTEDAHLTERRQVMMSTCC